MGKMPSSRRASYDSCRKRIAFQVCIVIPFAPTQFKESNVFIPAQFNKSSLLYKEVFSSLQIKGLAKFPKPKLLFLKKKKKSLLCLLILIFGSIQQRWKNSKPANESKAIKQFLK